MNNRNNPAPFMVTHANRFGVQKIISCNSLNEAIAVFDTVVQELGFRSPCNVTAANFPVLIWVLNTGNHTYEKALFLRPSTKAVPEASQTQFRMIDRKAIEQTAGNI